MSSTFRRRRCPVVWVGTPGQWYRPGEKSIEKIPAIIDSVKDLSDHTSTPPLAFVSERSHSSWWDHPARTEKKPIAVTPRTVKKPIAADENAPVVK